MHSSSSIIIRQENKADQPAVDTLLKAAFKRDEEAVLVGRLRNSSAFIPGLSLVAVLGDRIIGQILFTKINIRNSEGQKYPALALAPLSVLPEFQQQGVGALLMNSGLEAAAEENGAVIVLGHEHYYPKFGFLPAAKWNITASFEVPSANFMALELVPGALEHVSGVVEYAPEFGI
jgi:putative acetyltransferase